MPRHKKSLVQIKKELLARSEAFRTDLEDLKSGRTLYNAVDDLMFWSESDPQVYIKFRDRIIEQLDRIRYPADDQKRNSPTLYEELDRRGALALLLKSQMLFELGWYVHQYQRKELLSSIGQTRIRRSTVHKDVIYAFDRFREQLQHILSDRHLSPRYVANYLRILDAYMRHEFLALEEQPVDKSLAAYQFAKDVIDSIKKAADSEGVKLSTRLLFHIVAAVCSAGSFAETLFSPGGIKKMIHRKTENSLGQTPSETHE